MAQMFRKGDEVVKVGDIRTLGKTHLQSQKKFAITYSMLGENGLLMFPTEEERDKSFEGIYKMMQAVK